MMKRIAMIRQALLKNEINSWKIKKKTVESPLPMLEIAQASFARKNCIIIKCVSEGLILRSIVAMCLLVKKNGDAFSRYIKIF